jgi:hypothetical protein
MPCCEVVQPTRTSAEASSSRTYRRAKQASYIIHLLKLVTHILLRYKQFFCRIRLFLSNAYDAGHHWSTTAQTSSAA